MGTADTITIIITTTTTTTTTDAVPRSERCFILSEPSQAENNDGMRKQFIGSVVAHASSPRIESSLIAVTPGLT